ncbi:hypothetical protein RI367_008003 [Sorochytrium milnesiophthora]
MAQSAEPSEQQQAQKQQQQRKSSARGCGVLCWIFGFLITTVLLCLKIDYNASFSYLAAISASLAISAVSAVTSCSLLGFCNCATYVLIGLAADGRVAPYYIAIPWLIGQYSRTLERLPGNEGVQRGWRTLDLPRILQGVAIIAKVSGWLDGVDWAFVFLPLFLALAYVCWRIYYCRANREAAVHNLCLILAIVSLPLSSLSMVIFKLDRPAAGMRLTYCMIPLWSAIGVVPAILLLGGTMAAATYIVRISQPRLGRSDNNNGVNVTETEQQQQPPPYTASAELVPPPPAAYRAEGDNLA